MTKSGLIEAVADKTPHISKKDTEIVVNTIFDSMTQALRKGERIEIRGFGSFQVKIREAREGRNPKTGVTSSATHWANCSAARSTGPRTTNRTIVANGG